MSDDLANFLSNKSKAKTIKAHGSMICQQCNETVNDGFIDEDEMILFFYCKENHENAIKL